jgi:eukaryotic-like serine/threonine-protein kinase
VLRERLCWSKVREVGRYALYDELASGGMATVYLARLRGEVGFARVVAVKMLHAQYAREDAFRAMFLDEARLVSRIRHPNVVATLDVMQDEGELLLVMEYVHGETLARLLRQTSELGESVPLGVAVSIVADVLEGLHAAHEARSESGEPLRIVHRDVSPQNVLVAADGVAHVADFGVAKAVGRLAEKYSNQAVKGKAGYMPPEQMRGGGDHRADIYAAGVVLWEALVGERLFTGDSFLEIVTKALDAPVPPPSSKRPDVTPELDAVVKRAVSHDPAKRFATAREMAVALEAAFPRARARDVGEWVKHAASDMLEQRRAQIERIETNAPEPVEPSPKERPSPVSSPSIGSVSGIAPSHERTASRPLLPWLLIGGAVSVAAAATFALMRRTPDATIPVTVAAPPTTPSAIISTTPAMSTDPPEIVSVAPSATAPPRNATHNSSSRIPRPAPRTSASADCHWVELPNEQGIMIPKKVCP